jgi:hypothetical protein
VSAVPFPQSDLGRRARVDLRGDLEIFLFVQGEVGANRIHLRDRGQQRRRSDQIPELSRRNRGDASDQGPHLREAEIQPRRVDHRLGHLHRCLRGEVRLDIVVQLALRDRAFDGQRLVPFHVLFGASELGTGLRQLRFGERERRLERARVDFEEHVAFPDRRAVAVGRLHQVPRDLRTNLCVHQTIERRDPLRGDLDCFGCDGDDCDSRRGRRRSCRGGRFSSPAAGK